MLSVNTSILYLSQDESELIIINQKPVLKHKTNVDVGEEIAKGVSKSMVADQLQEDDKDGDGKDDEYDFVSKKSHASCKISEIKGFTFGGFSSRFWMTRKHINSMDRENLKAVPFYCWECLSLELKYRALDLVIRDEFQMMLLLDFLV